MADRRLAARMQLVEVEDAPTATSVSSAPDNHVPAVPEPESRGTTARMLRRWWPVAVLVVVGLVASALVASARDRAFVARIAAVPGLVRPLDSAPVPLWEAAGSPLPGTVLAADGALVVLAPISPQRSGPDLDTRATPVVRQVALSYGLAPELEMTRPAGPRDDLVAQPADSVAVDRTVAEVELADGRRVLIARTALVGRNPASDADVQLVRVVDPARSVSKTHLQIGVEPGGVWVADRGSTNGTVVTLPDGAQVVCRVDQQVRLRVGSTVSFGDCSLRLVRAPGSDPVS